jgi:hypothetical protein
MQPSIRFGLKENSMTIEHPRFPTAEDERRAALIYQTLRQLAEVNHDIPATNAPGTKEPAEAGLSGNGPTPR